MLKGYKNTLAICKPEKMEKELTHFISDWKRSLDMLYTFTLEWPSFHREKFDKQCREYRALWDAYKTAIKAFYGINVQVLFLNDCIHVQDVVTGELYATIDGVNRFLVLKF